MKNKKKNKTKSKKEVSVVFKGEAAEQLQTMAEDVGVEKPEEVVGKALALFQASIGSTVVLEKDGQRVEVRDVRKPKR